MSDQTTTDAMPETEGPTGEYRRLAEHPELLREWDAEKLLQHFLDTRLMIETDADMATNRERMRYVHLVDMFEVAEILRRMGSR